MNLELHSTVVGIVISRGSYSRHNDVAWCLV
jgi:hypothetical protein